MLFGLGNKVRFIHTGTEGVIRRFLDDGMIIVEVDRGIEIPASPEYLERVDKDLKSSSVKGKVIHEVPKEEKQGIPLPERQYQILRDEGIALAFEAKKRLDGTTASYAVYLLNVTQYQVTYDLKLSRKGEKLNAQSGSVAPESASKIMDMYADYLSDNPRVEIGCRQRSTAGDGEWLSKDFKLKPQQFFKREKTAALLDRKAFVYPLFKPFEEKERQGESLKKYTQKNHVPKKNMAKDEIYVRIGKSANVKEFAEFPREIDLHIERLVKDASKMSNGEILNIQIKAFEDYLRNAVRLGVVKVCVIHGKGKGKLKNEIATRLINHSEVKTFKDAHQTRYGAGGATEIEFS